MILINNIHHKELASYFTTTGISLFYELPISISTDADLRPAIIYKFSWSMCFRSFIKSDFALYVPANFYSGGATPLAKLLSKASFSAVSFDSASFNNSSYVFALPFLLKRYS